MKYPTLNNQLTKILFLVIAASCTLLVAGCSGKRTHDLADVRKAETIVLTKAAGQKGIHSLSVTGSGKIDGSAEISLILNGQVYKTESLTGSIAFQWGGDWYSDEAEIRYTPKTVTGGSLFLNYKFND